MQDPPRCFEPCVRNALSNDLPTSATFTSKALRDAAKREGVARIGDKWQPWRSVVSCLFWQSYLHAGGRAAPVLAPELYAAAE